MSFDLLAALDGTWRGRGKGGYPTIEDFGYAEHTCFEFDERYPLIHFQQRTILDDGEPGHWESGFVRVADDGSVEVSTAQNSGRVEVLRGPIAVTPEGFRLELESVALGHDARLVRTGRLIEVQGDRLWYEVKMSTTTTDQPRWLTHLSAELVRQPAEEA